MRRPRHPVWRIKPSCGHRLGPAKCNRGVDGGLILQQRASRWAPALRITLARFSLDRVLLRNITVSAGEQFTAADLTLAALAGGITGFRTPGLPPLEGYPRPMQEEFRRRGRERWRALLFAAAALMVPYLLAKA